MAAELGVETSPFFVYFWLPAGKDAFGFNDWGDAPLCFSGKYYGDVYLPIGLHLAARLREGDLVKEEIFKFTGNKFSITDSEFGMRKVEEPFVYCPRGDPGAAADPISGMFTLLSSGLYCFRLDIPIGSALGKSLRIASSLSADANEVETQAGDAKSFAGAFFNDVIHPLLDLGWRKYRAYSDKSGHLVITKKAPPPGAEPAEPERRAYKGVLSYYQLDLLYNAVFDAEAVPQGIFSQGAPELAAEQREAIDEKFALKNIVRSLTLLSWGQTGRQYILLGSDRKNYSLRSPDSKHIDNYFKPEVFLKPGEKLEGAALKEYLFNARLTYSAMEQFMRVAVTFGLSSYRDGLGCARKTILLNSMRAMENIEPHQLYLETRNIDAKSRASGSHTEPEAPPRRGLLARLANRDEPAHEETSEYAPITFSLSFAEIYYELMKSKLPGLRFLRVLLSDMNAAITDKQEKEARKEPGGGHYIVELEYSKKTFSGALNQFTRKCEIIEAETDAVRHLMERSGDRQILTELTDTRKIHELNAEDRIKVEISPEQWNRLSAGIGYTQIGAALAFGFLTLALWGIDKVYDADIDKVASVVSRIHDALLLVNRGAFVYLIAGLLAAQLVVFAVKMPTTIIRVVRTGSITLLLLATLFSYAMVKLISDWPGRDPLTFTKMQIENTKLEMILLVIMSGFFFAFLSWVLFEAMSQRHPSEKSADPLARGNEISTSIYDFANLRQAVPSERLHYLFERLKAETVMPSLFERRLVKCRIFNLLSEMPSVGIERRKYSFGSPPASSSRHSWPLRALRSLFSRGTSLLPGENYTLHVEIELHHPSEDAFLTDMRIAVRTMQKGRMFRDIDAEVKHLVYYYCGKILEKTPKHIRKSILRRHFAFTDKDIDRAGRECQKFPRGRREDEIDKQEAIS